ncbi:MAG: hypothetical protein ABSC63_08605 [Candidatus Binataceae bacterium]|jgi:hypothetical protein
MVNPIEQIGKSRRRLARLAAMTAAIDVTSPLIFTILFALGLDVIGALTWENFGYILTDERELLVGEILIGAVIAELIALAVLALLAYRKANDFLAAAEVVDNHIGGHQEILTLATLANPANQQGRDRRSPLFPMLWRRAIAYMDLFDPRREFKLKLVEPLKRSAAAAAVVMTALAIVTVALVVVPTPDQAIAHRLRVVARALDSTSATPAARDLVKAMRDVARDLENPKLPPEQKIQELAAMKRELERVEQQRQSGTSMAKNSSGGSGGGSGSGNSKGTGNGSGSGTGEGQGAGQGKGTGAGAGSGGSGKGNKTDQKMVELGNDLSKAQAQIEAEAGQQDKTKGSELANNGTGAAPKEGENPNASGPQKQPNGAGNVELPRPGSETRNNLPAQSGGTPSGRRDDKGSMGDTHLGEMPKAGNYERFYKPGEGPGLEIHDARYVTFRLPSAAVGNANGGRTVADAEHPVAAAGYTNAPLKAERLADTPDERQLVPPRYRDLIR